jgi:hypothetical protein
MTGDGIGHHEAANQQGRTRLSTFSEVAERATDQGSRPRSFKTVEPEFHLADQMAVATWARSQFSPGGGPGRLYFVAFLSRVPATDTIQVKGADLPSKEPVQAINATIVTRAKDPDWVSDWYSGPLRRQCEEVLGPDAPQLLAAECGVAVTAEFPDPPDLAYLQVAWEVVRSFLKQDGIAVLDCHQIRWFPCAEVVGWEPDRAFSIGQEIRIVLETKPRADRLGHMMHTRGMAKFGRPDVVLDSATPDRAEALGRLLNRFAVYMAMGARVSPGEKSRVEGMDFLVESYSPGATVPEVNLNNEGLLLRPA